MKRALFLFVAVIVCGACNKTAAEAKVPLDTKCTVADDCASTDMVKSEEGHCCSQCQLEAGTKKSIAEMHAWCSAHVAAPGVCPKLDCPTVATTLVCESGRCMVMKVE